MTKDNNKMGTSDVHVSSKQPLQADSLPTTTSKTSIRKDPKEDDYVAYTKLSHPVDENLLATNVKFSSAKGTIVDKVLHNLLLRSGDSAQKYLQGSKSVKLDNYILLDKFVQSRPSASGSKKTSSQKDSKRSKTRMSMKRLEKSGALHMPEYLQKFDLFKPIHGMWESYMTQLIKVAGKIQLASTLLSVDLHGAFMFVAECKIASFIGVQGIMVRETSKTCGIITRDDKFRGILKLFLHLFVKKVLFYLPKPSLVIVINLIRLYLRITLSSSSNLTAGKLLYLGTSLLQEKRLFNDDAAMKHWP
ncbi:PREDICTED: uncharacterized protein LOC104699757 [Camelina sativa]|uniref:Uncharacterized protein LOC104699757 n=1 Tax=Camelina sativa TaxID=90675 RepID=A0ABM1Q7Z3_CAMSA|nr:PREDICTED: uncharacterized protein LOC104699757 [Camelina sativa]